MAKKYISSSFYFSVQKISQRAKALDKLREKAEAAKAKAAKTEAKKPESKK